MMKQGSAVGQVMDRAADGFSSDDVKLQNPPLTKTAGILKTAWAHKVNTEHDMLHRRQTLF